MLFNDVDKNSFKQKLISANYYQRWKRSSDPPPGRRSKKYANKLA